MNTGFPRAMRATEVPAMDFHAVTDDSALTVAANRRKRGDCAFETVEGMGFAGH